MRKMVRPVRDSGKLESTFMLKRTLVILFSLLACLVTLSVTGLAQREPEVRVRRLASNPLVTVKTSPSLGDNVNGPAVIRVPDWVERPLGRYYMYFAHHKGHHIRLAYADAIEGPWKIHEPGVLHVKDTAFFRPQPDPANSAEGFYTHVASPEIHIDHARRRIVMWFHGWWTNGEMWPEGPAARQWANQRGYSQSTQSAESIDGLQFDVKPAITRASYLRVFPFENRFYAMARLGLLLRADAPFDAFTAGTNPFRDGPYAGRVRHVATLHRGSRLHVFFSGIGDAPERIMLTTVPLEGAWDRWLAGPAREVLTPETDYECPTLPNEPSLAGDVEGPVRQMRDPAVFEENGRAWLFYTVCGEQGIAAGELTFP